MNEDSMDALVDKKLAELLEHFDTVRIFVTWNEGGKENTKSYETGGGNFYAQLGQVYEWLSIQEQFQRNWADRKDDGKE